MLKEELEAAWGAIDDGVVKKIGSPDVSVG